MSSHAFFFSHPPATLTHTFTARITQAQEQRAQILAAINAFTLVCDQATINTFFKAVVKKLLELSNADANSPANGKSLSLRTALVLR